jgi:hypothetical protein
MELMDVISISLIAVCQHRRNKRIENSPQYGGELEGQRVVNGYASLEDEVQASIRSLSCYVGEMMVAFEKEEREKLGLLA